MIDHTTETVWALADVPSKLPRRRGGKLVDLATLYRWASHGCRGVRLETIQVGGTKCTSREALQRFFDHLTNQGCDSHVAGAASTHSTPTTSGASEDMAAVTNGQDPEPRRAQPQRRKPTMGTPGSPPVRRTDQAPTRGPESGTTDTPKIGADPAREAQPR